MQTRVRPGPATFSRSDEPPIGVANHQFRLALAVFRGRCHSVATIFVWMPLISDHPEEAKWISKAEKDYLITTLAAEKAERVAAASKQSGRATWSYKEILANKHLWLLTAVYTCACTGQWGYIFWLPTLVKKLTKASLTNVGLLSALPFIAAIGGLYIFGALSDRKGNRRLCTATCLSSFGICFWIAAQFPTSLLSG